MGGISFGLLPYWVPLCWFQFRRQMSSSHFFNLSVLITSHGIDSMHNFFCTSTGWFILIISLKSQKNLQGSFQYSFITEDTDILVSNIMVFWQATVRKSYLWIFCYYLAKFILLFQYCISSHHIWAWYTSENPIVYRENKFYIYYSWRNFLFVY